MNVVVCVCSLQSCERRAQRWVCREPGVLNAVLNLGTEGVLHWAFLHDNMNKRAAIGQQFNRAIAHMPDAQEVYQNLDDSMKVEFRKSWALKRDFEFVRETRSVAHVHRQGNSDEGEYLPEVTIASRLGSIDNLECRAMAASYVAACIKYGGSMVSFNVFLQAPCYLYIRKLVTSSSETEWKETVEAHNSVKVWSEKAKVCKARRHFAMCNGMKMEAVSESMVRESKEGIDTWAEVQVVAGVAGVAVPALPMSAASGKGKAKAKAQGKRVYQEVGAGTEDGEAVDRKVKVGTTKAASAANLVTKAEQEAKHTIALYTQVEMELENMQRAAATDPQTWSWAQHFLTEAAGLQQQIKAKEHSMGTFTGRFKAAALSAATMKQLRKEVGEQYLGKLMEYSSSTKDKLAELSMVVERVRVMSEVPTSGTQPAPKKKGAKRAPVT